MVSHGGAARGLRVTGVTDTLMVTIDGVKLLR